MEAVRPSRGDPPDAVTIGRRDLPDATSEEQKMMTDNRQRGPSTTRRRQR